MPNISDGLNYLYARNLSYKDILDFKIGYCDSNNQYTVFGDTSEYSLEYRFRDSIIIPVFDLYDKFLGNYTRRVFYKKGDPFPKISGSSWDKRSHLFGFNKSWSYCLDQDFVFITEGPFDMIACWKYGYKNCISVLGTALSDIQACLISRFCKKAVFLFDNDPAGKMGAKKASDILEKYNVSSKILSLSDDPDVVLAQNPSLLSKLI